MFSLFLKSYILIPVVMFLFSTLVKKQNLLKYMLIFAFVIGYMTFHLQEPDKSSDLFWHFQTIDAYKKMGFSYFFIFEKSTSLPIYSLYFYAISLLPSKNYLPAVTAFLVYGLNFYLIYRISRKVGLTKRSVILLMFFILCNLNYAGVIMGIRFNLAVSICLLGIYLDLIEKKNILVVLPLYLIPLFIHTSIFILLLLRILIIPFWGKTKNLIAILLVGITFLILKFLPSIVSSMSLSALNESINELFVKTDMYLKNMEQGAFWTVPYYALLIVFFAYIGIKFFLKYRWGSNYIGKFLVYYTLLFVMSVEFFNNYVVLGRIIIMSNLVAVPLIGRLLKDCENKKYRPFTVTYFEALIIVESLLRLFYYLYLGGYGAIKLVW